MESMRLATSRAVTKGIVGSGRIAANVLMSREYYVDTVRHRALILLRTYLSNLPKCLGIGTTTIFKALNMQRQCAAAGA
ncbi:hypothetical protein CHU98_g3542 [Xylaria longipes]|nr:hypothetical protein CHU98_g3542 [Xylaria longipes]